ncbi:hypothetical protein [Methylobacterium durans]|uniref:hypothetical protein n=1 Tax=Methylobacterium durans TaxID=2202825 RepID=UPI0013A5AA71|nr:hypothetical protein [Methylobacterium durans]
MKMVLVACCLVACTLLPSPAFAGQGVTRQTPERNAASGTTVRAMWVWTTQEIMKDPSEARRFLDGIRLARTTDVYLYLTAMDFISSEQAIRLLVESLKGLDVRAWAMEGSRSYFSDEDGPTALYNTIDGVVAFNKKFGIQLIGFHSDLEPQGGQGESKDLFHNGIASSKLSVEQISDRNRIVTDWLTIHQSLRNKCNASGLKYGGSMPSWADLYEGESISASFEGKTKPLVEFLLSFVDQYVIMAYNTSPSSVLGRVKGEIEVANTMKPRPSVIVGLETHAGPGENISYADTPSKMSKAAVTSDLVFLANSLKGQASFAGISVHDWVGWRDLPDAPHEAPILDDPTPAQEIIRDRRRAR